MPHKRATGLGKQQEQERRATDLAPRISLKHEPIPKSVSRVLDAERIRREYRKKKRQLDGANNSGCEGDCLDHKKRHLDTAEMKDDANIPAFRIGPSETAAEFDRRVEDGMLPLIKAALRQSSARARKVRREAAQETRGQGKQTKKLRDKRPESSKKDSDLAPAATTDESVNALNVTKEFQVASTSVPRRLNDVAKEPPLIKKLPRGATRNSTTSPGVVHKVKMEEEREKAIRHYRELKARKSYGS